VLPRRLAAALPRGAVYFGDMKKILILAGAALGSMALAQVTAPFGVPRGLAIADLMKMGATRDSDDTPGYYELDKVPTPNPAFEFYRIKASPKQGVCRVSGVGYTIGGDRDGTKTRTAFNGLEKALKA